MSVIRVMVAEDVSMLRTALVALLNQEHDLEVVADVGSGATIVPTAVRLRPDVAVIDVALPEVDGLDAAGELRRRLPECKVLILTGVGQPETLRRGASAGVVGFMVKDSSPQDLIDAIHTVAAGGQVVDPKLAYSTLQASDSPLTERETEVLRLTAEGSSPREVAAALHLSYGTVRNYLASAVMKLGARNRVDAIRIAREAGTL